MSKLQGRYDGAMEIKRKLYLRIILLINYMIEENLFVTKKKKRQKESDTWMD